jgi:hypothetical protein
VIRLASRRTKRIVGAPGTGLGAAQAITFGGLREVELLGLLNANLTVTLSGYRVGDVLRIPVKQDATGGRSLTINDGTASQSLPIKTDAGKDIYVEVRCLSATEVMAVVADPNTVAAPTNTVAPLVTGEGTVGNALTTDNGTWTGSPTSYAYQWQADGLNISGATANTYTPVSGDLNKTIRCVVTATNAGGSTAANSNGKVVTNAPFLDEPFTAADGTLLQNHSAVTTWTRHPSAGTADGVITANRLRNNDTSDFSSEDAMYYAGATPPSADYRVRLNSYVLTNDTNTLNRIYGRLPTGSMGGYSAGLDNSNDAVTLRVGSGTLLGSYTLPTPLANGSVAPEIDLLMVGSSIKVLVDGVERISVTDTTHTAAGTVGVQIRNITGATTGLHIDRLRAIAA